MMSSVIKVENISKQYRLGSVGTGSLAHDINRGWHRIRGKDDPYLKIGEINDRSIKGDSEYIWALQDINFEVRQGEVLGIIGRNGAGKSTLLKILSRTTTPTTGSIKIKGRVASLLEVGTGFHPELSGRENIFLNGAILGMTKKEIKKKFDEIVDFAGVERYIDTPVKRYSSGMYVRLAFGVAAHLEPEILIVDEVLAVGDAEFQKKALGKMKDVSAKDGRTVLFVSHNMAAVKNLCTSGLLMVNGTIARAGTIEEVITKYRIGSDIKLPDISDYSKRKGTGICRLKGVSVQKHNGEIATSFSLGDKFKIVLDLENMSDTPLQNLRIIIGVYNLDDEGYLRFDTNTVNAQVDIKSKSLKLTCFIEEHLNIKPDQYYLNIAIFQNDQMSDYIQGATRIQMNNFDYYGTGRTIPQPQLSKVFYRHSWKS